MQTTIVTGFSAGGFREYGKRFMQSFDAHHNGYLLHVYTQSVPLLGGYAAKISQFPQDGIAGLAEFLDKCADTPEVQGREGNGQWKPKEVKAGYSYRFDAHKFCKMVYTMAAAAHRIGTGYMIWLDGDTVVRQTIPADMAEQTLPGDCDYAYLGREPKHTETGYLVFRLPEALPVLDAWVEFYESGSFLEQKEWHSAYLFDRAREKCPDVKGHNLTPGGRGHVIHKCDVGLVFDHKKGKRKRLDLSPEARPI